MLRGKLLYFLFSLLVWSGYSLILLSGCQQADIEQLPPPRDVTLKQTPSFSQDIQPILNDFCVKCHNPRDAHKGLILDSYAGVMKGQKDGPVVLLGQPLQSTLLKVIKQETPPSLRMPFHQETLTPNRIQNIERWILQGALNN